jgi:hypothetical protein
VVECMKVKKRWGIYFRDGVDIKMGRGPCVPCISRINNTPYNQPRPGRYRNEDCLNLQLKDGLTVTFPLPPHDT